LPGESNDSCDVKMFKKIPTIISFVTSCCFVTIFDFVLTLNYGILYHSKKIFDEPGPLNKKERDFFWDPMSSQEGVSRQVSI
jgi:hypothetical protein